MASRRKVRKFRELPAAADARLGVYSSDRGRVVVNIPLEGGGIAVEMSPADAREMAHALWRAAKETEARSQA